MEEPGAAQEDWTLATAAGDRVELHARYRRGAPARAQVTSILRSAAHPDFTRTYRIDQATDVLRSVTAASDRIDDLRFSVVGPAFKALFDGSEQILSVTSIPYYTREISIP